MTKPRLVPLYIRLLPGLLLLCGVLTSPVQAEEFPSFRMTGAEGFLSTGQHSDESTTSSPFYAGGPQSQKQSEWRSELFLMTHSYVYHPKLLSLDIGGGPVYSAQQSDSEFGSGSARHTDYNFTAHATLLADKPLRGTLFYENLHPTPALSPSETFNQQNERYGFSAVMQAPATPVPLRLEASQAHNIGSSTQRTVDDQINDVSLNGERSLGKLGTTQLSYHARRQDSASGSLSLPIQASQQETQNLNLDTRLQLGDQNQYLLNNSINVSKQKFTLQRGPSPQADDFRFLLYYSGANSATLRSNAHFQYGNSRQDGRETKVNSGSAGLSWAATKDLDLSAGLRSEDQRSDLFSMHDWGIDGGAQYRQALPLGNLQAGYALRYDRREQQSGATQNLVVGENLVMSLTVPVTLARPRIIAGSVTVFNATRSQQYAEGVDYVLSVVGTGTRLQRLLGGSILEGENVLVDYSFDFGGSFASTQLGQGLNINWAVTPMLNLYLRYNRETPNLVSGAPTSPLNAVKSTVYGARIDVPLGFATEFLVGGYLEREDHQETLLSFIRTDGEAHVQGDLPGELGVNYRLATRRSLVSADLAQQNVNLAGYDLTLGWRHQSGLSLNASGLYERDTGGVEARERRVGTLQALWRFRQLSFSMNLSRTRESQGLYVLDRLSGNLMLRRDFSQ